MESLWVNDWFIRDGASTVMLTLSISFSSIFSRSWCFFVLRFYGIIPVNEFEMELSYANLDFFG